MPTIREELEAREETQLAPQAARSAKSRGRLRDEPQDPIRPVFQRDRDRVIHCSSFRRLEYKPQVFVNHEGDNYRTRLTHSLEGAQIGRTVARILGLNEELTETLVLVDTTAERFYEAEIYRLQGELLLTQVVSETQQAASCFR